MPIFSNKPRMLSRLVFLDYDSDDNDKRFCNRLLTNPSNETKNIILSGVCSLDRFCRETTLAAQSTGLPVCKNIAFMEILHKTVNLTCFSHNRNVFCISCQTICAAVFLNFLHKVGNSIIVSFLLFWSGDFLWLIDISSQKSCSSFGFQVGLWNCWLHWWMHILFFQYACAVLVHCTYVLVKSYLARLDCNTGLKVCVAPEINPRNLTCRCQSMQVRDPYWLWNPGQTSPDVQNRGISDPTKGLMSSKNF